MNRRDGAGVSDALRRLALACPIDGLALHGRASSLACEKGHAYDVSRHGHVNLLPVQFKPSKDPGDDRAMVDSRRRVLETGLFDPVTDAVMDAVVGPGGFDAAMGEAPLLVDVGCGDGYHTRRLAERLAVAGVAVLGVDISRHAIFAAARRHGDVAGWAVANNKRLPVLAGRCAVITSLFGFETWVPWAGLQTAGQRVVVVDAGPRHLIELREAIYARVDTHDAPSDAAALSAGYERVESRRVEWTSPSVSAASLGDVLAMTPHGHRASGDARQSVAQMDGGPLTIDVLVRTYRRAAA